MSCDWFVIYMAYVFGITGRGVRSLGIDNNLNPPITLVKNGFCLMCPAIHHGPKCMSCHKAIIVITGKAHCFHDYIYIG